jgi:hypothetical protein
MRLRKIVATIVMTALFLWAPAVIPVRAGLAPCGVPLTWVPSDTAFAVPVMIPCPTPVSGLGVGGGIAFGIIGVAAFLCLYDIWLKINGFKNWDGTPKIVPVHHHH